MATSTISPQVKPVAPAKPQKSGVAGGQKIFGLLLGIAAFLLLWFMPLTGLSKTGAHALAIAVLTAIWWIFTVMPPAFPAILACVLFFVLRVVRPVDAFSGFVNPSIWMLFFALIMAKGVERSGLGKRIASWLMSKTALSFNGIVAVFIALCIIFPFFLPSALASVALIMALALGIMDALGIERNPDNKVSSGLTCFVAVLALTMARAPLTGSVPNFIATGLVREVTGVDVSWIEWLKSMWVCIPIPAIATYLYITRLYKPDVALSPELMKKQIEATKASLGPWSGAEIRAAILVAAALLLWAFDPFLKIGTSEVGIIIGILFLMPYIGCLGIPDFKSLSWETFMFAGGSFSMGVVLAKTGFAQWAASAISKLSFLSGSGFVFAGMMVVLFAFALHFLLETLGEVSLLTPIILKTGLITPKAAAMLLPYGAGLYVFPFQGTPIILSLGFNTTGWKDVTKYAVFITVVGLLQSFLLMAVYWTFTMR
jgi:DASS family divalent anion:Na+ symporter